MERSRLIHHLITHYINRDEFRAAAHFHLRNRGLPYSITFISARYVNRPLEELEVVSHNNDVIEATRTSLERCRLETLDHIHDLLHTEPYLDEAQHIHTIDDIFRYIIEEVDDRVPELWTPFREASG